MKDPKPKIGFTALRTEESRSVYKLFDDNYTRAVRQAGGLHILLPAFVEAIAK
jgi:gamma-glutamyl-gamma-aminobutyrate hydrolase PuuD